MEKLLFTSESVTEGHPDILETIFQGIMEAIHEAGGYCIIKRLQ